MTSGGKRRRGGHCLHAFGTVATVSYPAGRRIGPLRANQDLLQRRLIQLAQAQAPGNPYGVGGAPGRARCR